MIFICELLEQLLVVLQLTIFLNCGHSVDEALNDGVLGSLISSVFGRNQPPPLGLANWNPVASHLSRDTLTKQLSDAVAPAVASTAINE